MAELPTRLLDRMLEQRVTLQLKDGRRLTGRLVGADEHLNVVLDDTDEVTEERARHLGRCVLRGSNVVSLNAPGGAAGKSG
ncbi:MAG TPA: LSM domain-containing protein [Thermoplasmata archaeon]|nr:LSM domain-containing protein [Thermoplasmata archaeon]